jgi:hypothetical protein
MIDMLSMKYETLVALAIVNFGLCSAIGWGCICRISAMSRETTKARWKGGYTLLLVAASASGLSPLLFREWPGPGQIGMALAALYVLGWGAQNWRGGPPPYARKPGPQDTLL